LTIQLYQINNEDYEGIIELTSNYLALPVVSNIMEYIQKEFGVENDNIFTLRESFDCGVFETVIAFIDTSNSNYTKSNTIDIILSTRRVYNRKTMNHITNLLKSETFEQILEDNSLKLKEFENVKPYLYR
jgi:hypothetical protein